MRTRGRFGDADEAAIRARELAEVTYCNKHGLLWRGWRRGRKHSTRSVDDRFVYYYILGILEPVIAPLRNLEDGIMGDAVVGFRLTRDHGLPEFVQ
jgi:hypothetical protein